MRDREIEWRRYDRRAQKLLLEHHVISVEPPGGVGLPLALQSPYKHFAHEIKKFISDQSYMVLEIGAGSGVNTSLLVSTGAHIIATDISEASLKVLQKRFEGATNLKTQVEDMEALSCENESFDVVVSAGSLSYGDNQIVMDEIYRVLKRGGVFIAVDSLHHHPVYRLNRWIHYRRGHRSLSTLKRMPTISLIEAYGHKFGRIEAHYFGSISWLSPIIRKIFGDMQTAKLSDKVDEFFRVRKSAFKFVMVSKKVKD